MQRLIITQPDDWHVHLRDNAALARTVPDIARQFSRAICMPNLATPVTTVEQALAYRQRILDHVPQGACFDPKMVLYFTDQTSKNDIQQITQSPHLLGLKLYPAGATTNSEHGVTDIKKIFPIIAEMEKHAVPLLIHGEMTATDIDIFDREKRFIEHSLRPLLANFPQLKLVFEHITTKDAVDFVLEQASHIGATITPQHLLFNRNDLLVGGVKPHYYCLPVLKRQSHQQALINAATSGNPKFFLGTDSAPHAQSAKESACGCAGCYSAPYAIELYAEVFEKAGKLDQLEGFASHFGADFYGLERNSEKVELLRQSQTIQQRLHYLDQDDLIPLAAGQTIAWSLL